MVLTQEVNCLAQEGGIDYIQETDICNKTDFMKRENN